MRRRIRTRVGHFLFGAPRKLRLLKSVRHWEVIFLDCFKSRGGFGDCICVAGAGMVLFGGVVELLFYG